MDPTVVEPWERDLINQFGSLFANDSPIFVPADAQLRFHDRLRRYTLQVAVMLPQDFTSHFRVLSHHLFGTQYGYEIVMTGACCQMLKHRRVYAPMFNNAGLDLDQYCNDLLNGRSNPNLIVLLAACHLFKITYRLLLTGDEMVDKSMVLREISPHILHVPSRMTFYASAGPAGIHALSHSAQRHVYYPTLLSIQQLDDLRMMMLSSTLNSDAVVDVCDQLLDHVPIVDFPKGEYHRHQKRIKELGFDRFVMPGDGNCALRTLAFFARSHHLTVRSMAVAQIKSNRARYDPFRFDQNEPFDAYVIRMSTPGVWADGAVIQAFCDVCRIRLVDVSSSINYVTAEFVPQGYFFREFYRALDSQHSDALFPNQGIQRHP